MIRHAIGCGLLVTLCVALIGCGSSGTGTNPPEPGATFEVGPLSVGTAAAAGFKTLTLGTPDYMPVAFTVLYGSRIVRLQEMGYNRLAYTRAVDDGPGDICTINTDGTGFVRLTVAAAREGHPTWNAVGTKIAFSSARVGNEEIYSMNADGSGLQRLTNDHAEDRWPAWSPAGGKIAFVSDRASGDADIWTMNANGSHLSQLTDSPNAESHPSWSPDGRFIAFATLEGSYDIWVMNSNGSAAYPVAETGDSEYAPVWSADGKLIYYNRTGDLWAVEPDGSNARQITHSPWHTGTTACSPDGLWLAFGRQLGPYDHLHVAHTDGSNARRVTNTRFTEYQPAWCPVRGVVRSLIGRLGSDGGSDPPFGGQRPLAIVALTKYGLVSAASVGIGTARWASVRVAALKDLGLELAGCRVTASKINNVQEDAGRGAEPRLWDLSGTPNVGAVLIFFNAATGRITSVVASADTALDAAAKVAAERRGGRIILQGEFLGAYNARDPHRNLASGPVTEVALDAKTGEVASAS